MSIAAALARIHDGNIALPGTGGISDIHFDPFSLPGLVPGPAVLFFRLRASGSSPGTIQILVNNETVVLHKVQSSAPRSFHEVLSSTQVQEHDNQLDVALIDRDDGSITVSDFLILYHVEAVRKDRVFVFRPGGVQRDNVYRRWVDLVDAMATVEGRKILEFDDSLKTPCVIPEMPEGRDAWDMKDVSWAGFGPRPGTPRPVVHIREGARLTNFRMIGGQITIENHATETPPISDFRAGDHVQIGLRDDCGNTELANIGEAPLFDIKVNGAFVFIQNCLFGLRSEHPLIRYAIPDGETPAKPLGLNLLGLNQTGHNVVEALSGAPVLFASQSSAAQIGADQTSTTASGILRFLPTGRIQRQVLPLPPQPPAQGPLSAIPGAQFLTVANVVLRCDGRGQGFVQPLPKIIGGFTMGVAAVVAYSGGQEVIVAETEGGTQLSVSPAAGDKIDGVLQAEVRIDPHGSRTFLSDGVDNWITISVVS